MSGRDCRDFGSGVIPTQVPVSSSRPTVPGLDYWEHWARGCAVARESEG
jgi:hypothetical protein